MIQWFKIPLRFYGIRPLPLSLVSSPCSLTQLIELQPHWPPFNTRVLTFAWASGCLHMLSLLPGRQSGGSSRGQIHQDLGYLRDLSWGWSGWRGEEREGMQHPPQLGLALWGGDSGSMEKTCKVFMTESCRAGEGPPKSPGLSSTELGAYGLEQEFPICINLESNYFN